MCPRDVGIKVYALKKNFRIEVQYSDLVAVQIKLWSYTWASILGAVPMAFLLVYLGRSAL